MHLNFAQDKSVFHAIIILENQKPYNRANILNMSEISQAGFQISIITQLLS